MDKVEEVSTAWCLATKDPQEAMMDLMNCLGSGHNAWIEIRENGDQEFPITMVNPLLDDPFNWQFNYGTRKDMEEIEKHSFLNDTERDLTMNWVGVMGTKEAVDAYKKDRTLMEGLILGGSVGCPVRIEDANRYRAEITGDNYKYDYFTSWWKPADDIELYVPDPSVGKVFTICYNNEPYDMKQACHRAGRFLINYAETLG